jgi:hypothetical protein
MLLDDLVQLWGHASGLPGLRVGMTTAEARSAVGGSLQRGELHFVAGDPVKDGPPAPLLGVVRPWREITLSADATNDFDESFWSGSALLADYLAAEMGAPRPRYQIGNRGQKLLRVRHRGLADGVPAALRFAADGWTEDGLAMEFSLLPERPWSDLIGDALRVGDALSALLDPASTAIPAGGTISVPAALDGGRVEALRAVDGTLRLRLLEGRSTGHEHAGASSAAIDVHDLLERLCPKGRIVEEAGQVVFGGLTSPAGSFEVRWLERPAQGVAEFTVRSLSKPA